MLSRVARGLYDLGRQVERAQNVSRVLEVNHKMNLERTAIDESNVWAAIAKAFCCELDVPTEAAIYGELVLSTNHPYSVRQCVAEARDHGRSMRDHISEEMWLHLNQAHLELTDLSFASILRIGRSEFNRRIEIFGEAFHGLAAGTMIRGESWSFLQLGKLSERATMICRIIEIKQEALALSPDSEGAPIDVHQWQALLRSLSGYEPYRRAYDARVVPQRVLEFVIKRDDFPRSLAFSVEGLRKELAQISGSNPAQTQLKRDTDRFLEELHSYDPAAFTDREGFESELKRFGRRCESLTETLDLGYFTSLRPSSEPIAAAPGAALVPQ